MDREQARKHFAESELSYADVNEQDVYRLSSILSEELSSYLVSGGEHAQGMGLKPSKLRKKDIYVLKRGLKSARIQVDGSYFKRREAITFSQTGFIGFAGEFDDKNTQPILQAFIRWCDEIASLKATTV